MAVKWDQMVGWLVVSYTYISCRLWMEKFWKRRKWLLLVHILMCFNPSLMDGKILKNVMRNWWNSEWLLSLVYILMCFNPSVYNWNKEKKQVVLTRTNEKLQKSGRSQIQMSITLSQERRVEGCSQCKGVSLYLVSLHNYQSKIIL